MYEKIYIFSNNIDDKYDWLKMNLRMMFLFTLTKLILIR